jgi:cytochrome c oxidase subunit 3
VSQAIASHPDHAAHPPHAHAHGHDHPPFLAHHWDNPKQQFEAGKLGMWLFLATEVLLFGGLFCGYAVWRGNHPEMFKYGSQFLDTTMGAINTAVLILSSLTMAWGVTCAQKGQQTGLRICLILTLMGAATFMVIKYFEYTHKFHEGWFPGLRFYDKPGHSHTWIADANVATGELTPITGGDRAPRNPADLGLPPTVPVEVSTVAPAAEGPEGMRPDALEAHATHDSHLHDSAHVVHPLQDPHRPANAHMFFNIYFMMTGLHGIHVIIGGAVIVWLLVLSLRGRFSPAYFTPVDLGGLYWHVVDLIWIFLFPLFYLI